MKKKYLIIISVFLVLTSCKKTTKDIERTYLVSWLEESNIDSSKFNWIVILPGLGCSGCIQEGEEFMKNSIENSQILFVLTKVESLKILQKKVDIKIKNYSNIYVDNTEGFDIPTNNSIYPCVVYLENSKVKSHEFQAPGNSAFENLEGILD